MISKKSLSAVFAVFVMIQSFCSAEIMGSRFKITESEKEFDVMYYVTPEMKVKEVTQNDDVAITQAFEISKDNIKADVYYSLFTDTGGAEESLMMDYVMWVFMCVNNSVGYEVDLEALSVFNNSDVQQEFNGDFGCTGFFQNPVSDYANGHQYMMVEFFYKQNQGLVMRSFLFDDIGFMGITEDGHMSPDSLWLANYHTFEFMEKNDKGEFIIKGRE